MLEFVIEPDPATLWKMEKLENTSENQAELIALVNAMSRVKEHCEIDVYIDSDYVAAGFRQGWMDKWKKNDWKNAKGKEIANKTEWERLSELKEGHIITIHVKENHSYRTWLERQVIRESKGEKTDV